MNRLRWTPEVPRWAIGISVATVMGAGALVGCGDDVAEEPEAPRNEVTQEAELFDTETVFQEGFMQTIISDAGGDDATLSVFCQGTDLVDFLDTYSGGGSDRTENHSACADGRLTPDDFPSAEVIADTTTTSIPG